MASHGDLGSRHVHQQYPVQHSWQALIAQIVKRMPKALDRAQRRRAPTVTHSVVVVVVVVVGVGGGPVCANPCNALHMFD